MQQDNFALALAKQNAGRLKEASTLYHTVLAGDPTHAFAYHNLGLILFDTVGVGAALPLLWYAAQLQPDLPDARNSLGNALLATGRKDEAEAEFREAIKLAPGNEVYHFNLANLLTSADRAGEAEVVFREAIRIRPNYVEAWNNLGNALRTLGRHEDGLAAFEKVISIDPKFALAHNNIGNLKRDSGDSPEAESYYRAAIQQDPKLAIAHFNLGNVLRETGRIAEAAASFRKAIELQPRNADAYRHLVQVERISPDDGLVAYMQAFYENPLSPDAEKVHLGFALGRIFDQSKKWDDAFRYLYTANKLHRKTYNYDVRSETRLLCRIREQYSAERIARMPRSGIQDKTPVFIIGMLRSGTTLMEQILASHPEVQGGGELYFVQDIVSELRTTTKLPFPDSARDLATSDVVRFGETYLQRLRQKFGNAASRITDKMPQNFMYVGLISQILPEARFIYMKRNPMDVALSMYSIHFTEPHPYAYELTELGQYLRFSQEVMDHWISHFGSKIYVQSYEDLVENNEAAIRGVLDFIDLPFDPACLDFHRTERLVNTASATQVREKLNSSSIGRWKPYERYLRNLKAVLAAD